MRTKPAAWLGAALSIAVGALVACSSAAQPGGDAAAGAGAHAGSEVTTELGGARTSGGNGATSGSLGGGGQVTASGSGGVAGAAGSPGSPPGVGGTGVGGTSGSSGGEQAVAGQAGSAGSSGAAAADAFVLGVAGYTVREFSVDESLQWMQKWGLHKWAVKDVHLGLGSSTDAIAAFLAKAKASDVDVYSAGVIYMYSEADVDKAFSYAKKLGIDHFTGVPSYDLLPSVDRAVKATGIRIAIHNHGPDPEPYPTPDDIFSRIKNLDARIGMCLDIGHAVRAKVDPSAALEKYADRIFDVHLKDVDRADASGKTVVFGKGVIDLGRFLQTLRKVKYSGVLGIEFESDKSTTEAAVAQSADYFRDLTKAR